MFRERMASHGFNIVLGEHPIVPVMLGDAALAAQMADMLLKRGIYVVAFHIPSFLRAKLAFVYKYPPAHTPEELEFAVEQFAATKSKLGI